MRGLHALASKTGRLIIQLLLRSSMFQLCGRAPFPVGGRGGGNSNTPKNGETEIRQQLACLAHTPQLTRAAVAAHHWPGPPATTPAVGHTPKRKNAA